LVVVAPSLDAEADVLAYKKAHGPKYPLLTDARNLAQSFGVKGFPTMFLVGKDGKILWKDHFSSPELEKLIPSALAAEAPAPAPVPIYVLKDGRRIPSATKMEADGKVILRDPDGRTYSVDPAEIQEVVKGEASKTEAPAKGEAPAAEPPAKSAHPVVVLKDGRRIVAVMKMDMGDEVSVKDEAGKMQVIPKKEIQEIIPAGQ